MGKAQHVTLILTTDLHGLGTRADPYRRVTELWTSEGELVVSGSPNGLAEHDPTITGPGWQKLSGQAW